MYSLMIPLSFFFKEKYLNRLNTSSIHLYFSFKETALKSISLDTFIISAIWLILSMCVSCMMMFMLQLCQDRHFCKVSLFRAHFALEFALIWGSFCIVQDCFW